MKWIKSGIENPLKSEVIGRGGDEKTNDHAERQKSNSKETKNKIAVS